MGVHTLTDSPSRTLVSIGVIYVDDVHLNTQTLKTFMYNDLKVFKTVIYAFHFDEPRLSSSRRHKIRPPMFMHSIALCFEFLINLGLLACLESKAVIAKPKVGNTMPLIFPIAPFGLCKSISPHC